MISIDVCKISGKAGVAAFAVKSLLSRVLTKLPLAENKSRDNPQF